MLGRTGTIFAAGAAVAAMTFAAPAMAEDLTDGFAEFGVVVEAAELETTRGMDIEDDFEDIFTAISIGNTADGDGTRTNEISGNAFRGASGIATVIQNAGDNVIIQTATVVNVSFVD